jgi:two-component system, OmpR family, response regulator
MEPRSLRILLVEDDGSIARVIVIAMRALGVPYKLDQAFSGEEGVDMWAKQPYDLVLTDYNLRGMSGIHMVAEMKSSAPDLPTVLFTAYDDAAVRKEAKTAGISRFITKPFIVDEFIAITRGLLPARANEHGASASSEF